MKLRHFLSIFDLSAKEIWQLFVLAKKLKKELKEKGENTPLLKNKTLAMVFEKPSLRTRVSFETAMTQLGGHALYLAPADIGMGKRESISDVARVISSMADIIMARTFKHETIIELAKNSKVPVINGLSDLEHPCQILADYMTVWEKKGKLEGLTIGYVGDGENNVTHSLCLGAAILGMDFKYGSPKGYWMSEKVVGKAKKLVKKTDVKILATDNPKKAVENVDVVVTDTWVSMGDEAEKKQRMKIFKPYQVNQKLISLAKKEAIFMHCLPAYRGNEVASKVIDGKQSVVFQEAENRLHVQKALLLYLLKEVLK
jgi:ornithine carbamoyltransferase